MFFHAGEMNIISLKSVFSFTRIVKINIYILLKLFKKKKFNLAVHQGLIQRTTFEQAKIECKCSCKGNTYGIRM